MNKLMVAVYLALLICPFIAIVITVPFVVVQYRKTKVINVIRCANFYLLIFFTLCAYFVTMLPFPTFEEIKKIRGPYIQLIPFYCIYDFFKNSGLVISDWKTVIPAFSGGIMIGIVFNILMLVPSGFFLRRLYNLKMREILLIGFMISLIFEFTQLSGLFGIYPHPYRVFDVDDLIQNTFGMVVGAQLSFVWRLFKAPSHITIRQGGEVSLRRRFIADIIDELILNIILLIVIYFSKKNIVFFAIHPLKSFPLYFELIMLLNLGLGLIVYLGKGQSLGMKLMGLRLRDMNGNRPELWQCTLRSGIYAIFLNLPILIGFCIKLSVGRNIIVSILCIFLSAELVFSYVCFTLSLALHVVTHGEKLIYEKASRTHLGLEVERSVRNRQKVIYRNKLLPDKIEPASDAIYEILKNYEEDSEVCKKMKYMVESALLTWMDNGLRGHIFTVQIDRRFAKKSLLVCVLGKKVKAVGDIDTRRPADEVIEVISDTRKLFDTRLSYDTYYTGGVNVFAIEL